MSEERQREKRAVPRWTFWTWTRIVAASIWGFIALPLLNGQQIGAGEIVGLVALPLIMLAVYLIARLDHRFS